MFFFGKRTQAGMACSLFRQVLRRLWNWGSDIFLMFFVVFSVEGVVIKLASFRDAVRSLSHRIPLSPGLNSTRAVLVVGLLTDETTGLTIDAMVPV